MIIDISCSDSSHTVASDSVVTGFERPKSPPVTTDWSREKVVQFLIEQYDNNVDNAIELLKLRLQLDVKEKLAGEVVEPADVLEHIKSVILSFHEYPREIAMLVLNDHIDRKFVFRVPGQSAANVMPDNSNVDDIPF